MGYDFFEEYSKEKEPNKYYKSYAWKTAIGLQEVDGLTPSEYLKKTAIDIINGDISFEQAHNLINEYYKEKKEVNERTEEADKVSLRIAEILSENSFSFTPTEYISIHKRLFSGIYEFAGQLRKNNISKEEWVLDGASVIYGNAFSLLDNLNYDFKIEKEFVYKGLNKDEIVSHLASFVANLWQNHIFGEGNTRTTAVFLIKYLRKLGFDVNNDVFEKNSWYFRNALVRANYNNFSLGVYETT